MDITLANFFMPLLAIVVIDLALAGDNAIVIGMAARNLPVHQQKKVIIFGTIGAIIIRILATLVVVWLLSIPGLRLLGGIILLWISYKLIVDKEETNETVRVSLSFWRAVTTIIIADMVMGLDNVLAIAAAAQGEFLLVVIGLIISIPLIIFGSTLVIKLMERFPWLIYVGAAIIAWTAGVMMTDEPFINREIAGLFAVKWGIVIMSTIVVFVAGRLTMRRRERIGQEQSMK